MDLYISSKDWYISVLELLELITDIQYLITNIMISTNRGYSPRSPRIGKIGVLQCRPNMYLQNLVWTFCTAYLSNIEPIIEVGGFFADAENVTFLTVKFHAPSFSPGIEVLEVFF